MTSYFEMLRPVEPGDLDGYPKIVDILKTTKPQECVTSEMFRHLGKDHAAHGLVRACSKGVLKRISPYEKILGLDSVKFWCTQFNKPGFKNTAPRSSTKRLYLGAVSKFDKWLSGRSFPSYKTVVSDGQIERQAIKKSFASVEELMHYCNESDHGTKTAQRVVREYLASPHVLEMSIGRQSTILSAIKSYFAVHDVILALPKKRQKRKEPTPGDDDAMSLEDLYNMLQKGNPNITLRTVILIKFQSAMDSATLTDRFNYDGYAQLVRYFKTDDHTTWNIDRCPVPIKTVRVKNSIQYTTFIDRDAVDQLKEYLTWKENKHGKHDASKPLFLTKQNDSIHSTWLSTSFSMIAKRAGNQKKMSARVFKMRAHDVRDLLKSTLRASGCKDYAAEHIIGHAPRNSYEKEAVLYPEELRAEYAKASSRINIFSKAASTLNSPKDQASQEARIKELESQIRELTQAKTENTMKDGHYENVINTMSKEIKRLVKLFDSLPDDIKEKMTDKLEDTK